MEQSSIAWTESTFSPWEGCTKASSGCLNCYAESLNRRLRKHENWGPGAPRRKMSEAYWQQPLKWNRKAASAGKVVRVFPSICDLFDDEGLRDDRNRFWDLTKSTPNLAWQALTKRPENFGAFLPRDWGNGYPNVWLGVTAENRREALRRIEILRDTPAVVKFVSAEPLLEDLGQLDLHGIDWIIVGGESGRGARPMAVEWATSLLNQSQAQGVRFFMKQLGRVAYMNNERLVVLNSEGRPDGHAGDPEMWPRSLDHLNVRQVPDLIVSR